jgi:hypothetical protein
MCEVVPFTENGEMHCLVWYECDAAEFLIKIFFSCPYCCSLELFLRILLKGTCVLSRAL